MDAAVARGIRRVIRVAEPAGRLAPSAQGAALAIEAGLGAEGRVVAEARGPVVGVEHEPGVVVPQVAAGGIPGLEREAVAAAQTGAHRPAGLLLEGGAARRRDDLGVDSEAGVGEVARRGPGGRGLQGDGGAGGEGGAAGHGGSGVFGGDDVGLDGGLGVVGRVAGGHDALVEGALAVDAVVAADAEDDGALLAHRVVAGDAGARAAVVRRELAGGRVGAADRPLARLPLDDGGDEAGGDGRVARVLGGALAREQAVLEIGHDPGPAAGAGAPDGAVAVVDGLHVAVARVRVAGLGVAVVEAAAVIVVRPVDDGVDALRRVALRRPAGGVAAVARAGRDEDAVRPLPVQRDRGARRAGQAVVATGFRAAEAAGRSLHEVVIAAGLVVYNRDEAGRAGAEVVLGAGISDTAGRQRIDVGRGAVRVASHLVQRAVEAAVQGARGAVRGNAGRPARGIDVAGRGGGQGRRGNKA